jgi:hypothetical protein
VTFGRPSPQESIARREAERAANFRALCQPVQSLHSGSYGGTVIGSPISKEEPMRSEGYRRLVATLPCKVCGIVGYSQAAHPNTGKGSGFKTDDRLCFPLCGPRPSEAGCHSKFDQHALFSKAVRRELEPVWGADTRRQITAAGTWPKNLPKWKED